MNKPTSTPDYNGQAPISSESMPLATGKTVVEKTKQNLATVQGRMPGLPGGPSNVPPGGREMIGGYSGNGSDTQVSSESGRKTTGTMTRSKIIKGDKSQVEIL